MSWRRIALGSALAAGLALCPPAARGDAGLWSVTARYERGTSDEAVEGEGVPYWYGVALRWDSGTKVPFFFELPFVHVENAGDVLLTGAGPVGGPQGPGAGPGHGEGPGGGSGGGPGPAGTVPTAVEMTRDWTGVGDLRAGVAVPIIGGAARRQWLEALAEVKAPTSPDDSPVSSGEWDGRVGAGWGYRFFALELVLDAGWNFIGNPPGYELKDAPDACVTVLWESARPSLLWSAWLSGRGEIAEGSGMGGTLGLEIGSPGAIRWRTRVSAGIGPGAGYDYALSFVLEFGGPASDPSRWRSPR